jgi:hypothetical protein
MAPPGDYAFGKVKLPAPAVDDAPPSSRSHRMRNTLHGIGEQRECPSMNGCQLALLNALNERDARWELRLSGIEGRLGQVHAVLDQWLTSKGIRNSDSTPAGKGALNVEAGPVKLKGKAWIIVALAIAVVSIGAVAYVLGEWGRPTQSQAAQQPK